MILKVAEIQTLANSLVSEIERCVLGKHEIIEKAVITLLCNGHLLLEDIPGVGKTTTAKALARVIGGEFRRVQFTPDLLPADVTGAAIYNPKENVFEFRPGPIFANVVLVDEINRATPKTQSALLEAMEERQVSSDGVTRDLPRPCFIIATQNNVEMTGTYPLPEAQLDRFFARLSLGYPDEASEQAMLASRQTADPLESLRVITSPQQLMDIQKGIQEVHVSDPVRSYIVDLVRATREHALILLGASPRGSIFLLRAAQAQAVLHGMDHVTPDHVKQVATMTLGHRVIPRGEVRARGTTTDQIITQILDTVPTPIQVA